MCGCGCVCVCVSMCLSVCLLKSARLMDTFKTGFEMTQLQAECFYRCVGGYAGAGSGVCLSVCLTNLSAEDRKTDGSV